MMKNRKPFYFCSEPTCSDEMWRKSRQLLTLILIAEKNISPFPVALKLPNNCEQFGHSCRNFKKMHERISLFRRRFEHFFSCFSSRKVFHNLPITFILWKRTFFVNIYLRRVHRRVFRIAFTSCPRFTKELKKLFGELSPQWRAVKRYEMLQYQSWKAFIVNYDLVVEATTCWASIRLRCLHNLHIIRDYFAVDKICLYPPSFPLVCRLSSKQENCFYDRNFLQFYS